MFHLVLKLFGTLLFGEEYNELLDHTHLLVGEAVAEIFQKLVGLALTNFALLLSLVLVYQLAFALLANQLITEVQLMDLWWHCHDALQFHFADRGVWMLTDLLR
jgi:hypothetical protein